VDTLNPLPPPLRHGIEQTLAAQRLEGWRHSAEHVNALVALIGGELAYGDYLAAHRARHPPPEPPRRTFRRKRPYLIPGTTMLRNNFGTSSPTVLAELEFVATAGRIAQWHQRIAAGELTVDDVDICGLHQHVFADVYPWAGRLRVTELRRGDVGFARRSAVAAATADIESAARQLATRADLDNAALAYEFSRLYGDYNQVHPFREGNGRTGTLMLHTVAALCGRRLDLSGLSRADWYAASRDSMPFRRDGPANHRPFLPLFTWAIAGEPGQR
jgi:cell filamentation protein